MMRAPTPITAARVLFMIKKYRLDLKTRGAGSLVGIARDALGKIRRLLFSKDRYFLYVFDLQRAPELPAMKPKVDAITMTSVFLPISIEEYERLGETGYDFRKHPDAREFVPGDKGTMVFLGIHEDRIIYRSCLSTYCNGVYSYIYPAHMQKEGTLYQGFNETAVEFRNKGLYSWAQGEMFRHFHDLGFSAVVMLEPEDQVGPRKVQDRLGSKQLCESFCLRVLLFFTYRWNEPRI